MFYKVEFSVHIDVGRSALQLTSLRLQRLVGVWARESTPRDSTSAVIVVGGGGHTADPATGQLLQSFLVILERLFSWHRNIWMHLLINSFLVNIR